MAYWIQLPTISDPRGSLTVLDQILPFDIKRVYYIYQVTEKRGGHRHHKTIQALVCLSGSCEVFVDDNISQKTYRLDNPSQCLILETKDWHTMDQFSASAVLLVISSEHYDRADYIDEPYSK